MKWFITKNFKVCLWTGVVSNLPLDFWQPKIYLSSSVPSEQQPWDLLCHWCCWCCGRASRLTLKSLISYQWMKERPEAFYRWSFISLWEVACGLALFNWLPSVHFTSFTLRDVWVNSEQHDSVFVNAGKANCSFQLPNSFLAVPIHTIKLKLTGDLTVIPPSPKDILTKNPYFPLGLVWFCCYHWSNEGGIHCPLPFNGGNNCQPAWPVMLKSRKNLFNHGSCFSIQKAPL